MPITNYLAANLPRKPALSARFTLGLLAVSITAAVAPQALAQSEPEFSNGFYAGFNEDIPEVLTTTRLRQTKTRVPGSTTVIDGDLIRNLGIVNLYEVFRLVPGMAVTFVGSHTPVTTYHGTVHYEQRRIDRKSTRLNSSHLKISYAVFCMKKKKAH